MNEPLSFQHLRRVPLDTLARELEVRLSSKLAPHRIGDPWPQVTVNDWCTLTGYMLRLGEKINRLLELTDRDGNRD